MNQQHEFTVFRRDVQLAILFVLLVTEILIVAKFTATIL